MVLHIHVISNRHWGTRYMSDENTDDACQQAMTVLTHCFNTSTHWGTVMHWYRWTGSSLVSGNGLTPMWFQAITWTNDDLLSIGHFYTNLSEISIKTFQFSFKIMHVKMSCSYIMMRYLCEKTNPSTTREPMRCWPSDVIQYVCYVIWDMWIIIVCSHRRDGMVVADGLAPIWH